MTPADRSAGTVSSMSEPDDEPIDVEQIAAREDALDEVVDVLPEDLDPTSDLVGPYLFPNNNRRRVPGILYLIIGVGLAVLWAVRRGGDPVLVNGGILGAALLLVVIGAFHLLAGWNLDVDEEAALDAAAAVVQQPVGHASAQMGWRGWTSRPTWRILWYSAEDPPEHRGLVLVDGHDGRVLSWFSEDNPEDWTSLDGRLDGE
jgi:hypothetical protein